MGRFLFASIFIALLAFGCKSNIETVENTNSAGYTERYERRKSDYAKEGKYAKFDPDGQILEEAQYSNDTLNGYRILYYENGDTQIVEKYEMGTFSGFYKVFYPNGQEKLVGQYQNNKMTGPWKAYYEDGQLKEVVTFRDNNENGPFIEYHPNGNLKAEGTYLDGDREHGELKLYDENGKHIKTMMCDRGNCRTTWEAENSNN